MIYYTLSTPSSFPVGEAVQTSSGGGIEAHTTGEVLGVVLSSVSLNDENTEFATKIYSAGGGGVEMILGSAWDGSPSRFEFAQGRVQPVSTGGDGWLIPDYPAVSKVAGDTVRGAIYK
jgi:hypothetical protein